MYSGLTIFTARFGETAILQLPISCFTSDECLQGYVLAAISVKQMPRARPVESHVTSYKRVYLALGLTWTTQSGRGQAEFYLSLVFNLIPRRPRFKRRYLKPQQKLALDMISKMPWVKPVESK